MDLNRRIAEHESATETYNLPEVRTARRLLQEAITRSSYRGILEPLVSGYVNSELLHRRVEAAGQEATDALAVVWADLRDSPEIKLLLDNFVPGKGRPSQPQQHLGSEQGAAKSGETGGGEHRDEAAAQQPAQDEPSSSAPPLESRSTCCSGPRCGPAAN